MNATQDRGGVQHGIGEESYTDHDPGKPTSFNKLRCSDKFAVPILITSTQNCNKLVQRPLVHCLSFTCRIVCLCDLKPNNLEITLLLMMFNDQMSLIMELPDSPSISCRKIC